MGVVGVYSCAWPRGPECMCGRFWQLAKGAVVGAGRGVAWGERWNVRGERGWWRDFEEDLVLLSSGGADFDRNFSNFFE